MSKKIYPGSACRLEFIVEDADGLPVPSLTHSDVSSSAYRNRTNGVQSSATTATVTSSVASTATVSAGQFVTIDSARGHYAIDVASGAAGATLDYAEAVVAFTAGHTVTPIQHEIDETLYEVNAAKTLITTVDSVVDLIKAETDTISTDVIPDILIIKVQTENTDSNYNNLSLQVDDVYQIVLSNLDVAVSVIQSQITALNNLSAKANWFGYPLLEVPDSSTRAYVFELVVRDDEDKLVNLDGLPTIALTNAAGTDRSALITTGVANPSTGRYTITITVGVATANESLKLTATGTIGAETRYASYGTQVVDYDTATLVNQILTTLGVNGAGLSAVPWNGAWGTSLQNELESYRTNGVASDNDAQVIVGGNTQINSVVDSIYLDTVNIGTNGAGLLDIPWNAAWDSFIQTKVQDAIEANFLNYLFAVDYNPASKPGVATALLNELIESDAGVSRFTANALELAPAGGGGGGGDATLANQELILEAIETLGADQLAAIEIDAGVISGFPETLTIGDSYTVDTGQIKVVITDVNGDPITAFGSLQLDEADISFKAFRPNDSAIIVGICEFVDDSPTETYVLISLERSETSKGKAEFTYEGRLKFIWYGASSSDTDDDTQKTYKTTPFKFLANP